MFIKEFKKTTGQYDTHHIMKVQECKKHDLEPNIYFNMIWIHRSLHGNLHSSSISKFAKETRYEVYEIVKNEFWTTILNNGLSSLFTEEDYNNIKFLWEWCILHGYNKKDGFYYDNYDEIIDGYKVLVKLSKEI